jgi:hypothetical protein
MPTARTDLAAATGPDGRVYAIGGNHGGPDNTFNPVGTVEAYDPSTNTWSTVAPMPTARNALAAVVGPDGRIYAMGGYAASILDTVEAYSPATNSWTAGASLPTPRTALAAALGSDGRIYAIGGVAVLNGAALNTVAAYTPTISGTATPTVVASGATSTATSTSTPAVPGTATPTPPPTATATATRGAQTSIERIWLATMRAEAKVTSVHSKGTFADSKTRVPFVGNCAPQAFDIQLSGKDKHGHAVTVEYLSVQNGFWSRSHRAKKPWSKWKREPGYNADVFIPFVGVLCPQVSAKTLAQAPLAQVDALVKDLGSDHIGGTTVRHLRLAVEGSSEDFYVTETTYYWVRWKVADQQSHSGWTATYSRINHVTLKPPV